MPYTNYKLLKERMSKISKGFWKVQSIHKLATKLSNHFTTKDFILMKSLTKSPILPSFITLVNESKMRNENKVYLPKKTKSKLSREKIFLTGENDLKKRNFSNEPKLYVNFYKNFPYEPFLYNDLQFFYLQGNSKYTPRKFNDVVRDCFIMNQYTQFIKDIKQQRNLSNISNTNTSNTNSNANTISNYGYRTCSDLQSIYQNQKKYKIENNQNSGKRLSFNVIINTDNTSKRLHSRNSENKRSNTLPGLKYFRKNYSSKNYKYSNA